ncbi:M61 family metallopeptidase [Shewanella sp. NIFS-20-20]|uniref:M61 family metallopeptidase n=1 Tax=Shewanella sp. NIFS-20-20 TaxID=2853806 RepID=UPI001C4752B0|nr:PDZ domain-containing protein [Shewanella sp. NIFS-20-20]MBV7315359.1 PDZ domain-containing protein [Shewanella sp. NIFS-20-20]
MKPAIRVFFAIGTIFSASALADVQYKIDLRQPEHQLAQVEVIFPSANTASLTVNLPVWRTGKYQVLPLADGIRQFSAFDAQGAPLAVTRTASGEWQVALTEPTSVRVTYQIHGDMLGSRVRHIDESHAFLDASGVFVYSPEFRDDNLRVSLEVPEGWNSYSGMTSGWQPHTFVAPNYDVLVDSPIETGISQMRSFSANGREYELVVWGEGNYNLDQMEQDLKALSATAEVIWDDYPFERYVYMVHATSGERGATEHLNSTIIQLPRFNFRERKDYLRFIGTASHEFIHTWNVKQYRPEGLAKYEYQQETISPLLWLSEGSTSYFQYQLLLRAGVITHDEFMEDIAKRISNNLNRPGASQQSIAEASETTWIAQGGDYSTNHGVNIYSEGFLVSLALDFDLLEQTGLKHSYRDVHRRLYRDFRLPAGFGVADVKGILADLSGRSYDDWWQQHIDSPWQANYPELLALAGLELSYGKEQQVEADLGVTLGKTSLRLSHVKRDGAAWKAGLHAGDEIVAINGLKVTADGFDKRLQDFEPGQQIEVSFFNDDILTRRTVVLEEKPKGKLQIKPLEGVSDSQKAFFKAWLGIDWPYQS